METPTACSKWSGISSRTRSNSFRAAATSPYSSGAAKAPRESWSARRSRDRSGVPAARLRTLPSGGRQQCPSPQRPGPRPGNRPPPCRTARRQRHRRKRRPRPRRPIHSGATTRSVAKRRGSAGVSGTRAAAGVAAGAQLPPPPPTLVPSLHTSCGRRPFATLGLSAELRGRRIQGGVPIAGTSDRRPLDGATRSALPE
jgi:hypothetical protein